MQLMTPAADAAGQDVIAPSYDPSAAKQNSENGADGTTVVLAPSTAGQLDLPAVSGRSYVLRQVADPVSARTSATVTGSPAVQARTLGPVSIGLPGGKRLVSAASGRCLDVPAGVATSGIQVQIWDCDSGAGQQWTAGTGRTLTSLGKCLDADGGGTAPGTRVILWDCHGGTNQQWTFAADGTIRGVASGLCLDVTGGSTVSGAPLELWSCTAAANQRWSRG